MSLKEKILNNPYHEINEQNAKIAKRYSSFGNYEQGSATKEYQRVINETRQGAIKKLEDNELDQYNTNRLIKFLNKFEKLYADHKNKEFQIAAMNPSQMISGAAGFNHQKHKKQMDSYDNLLSGYREIEKLQNSILNFLPIKEKVEKKYNVDRDEDYENKHFSVIINDELNRVQLKFEGKPEIEERTLLKKNGFRWAPSQKAWQRQLTPNAIHSIKYLVKDFDELNQTQEVSKRR